MTIDKILNNNVAVILEGEKEKIGDLFQCILITL